MSIHYVAIPTVSALGINAHTRLSQRLKHLAMKGSAYLDYVDNFMPQWAARKEIMRRFLSGNYSFLTMIDCDTVPAMLPFHHISEDKLSTAIYAGYYALYTDQGMFQWSVGRSLSAGVYQFATHVPPGESEWDVCGFGCVTFPRSIASDLTNKGAFDGPPPEHTTEDVPICQQARAMGIKIRTHHDLICEHWRTVDISYQLRIQNELIDKAVEIGKANKVIAVER